MGIVRSIKKSWKIREISKVLGAPLDIATFASGGPARADRALEELLSFCETDPDLNRAMQLNGATRTSLRRCYQLLCANGAGQWVRGHYVPVSALAFVPTLSFVLEHSADMRWSDLSVLLLEYFERNEVGPVPLRMRGPADQNDPLRAVWDLEQRRKRSE